ncbi:anoctamin-7-like [Uloborus diversus]|uniref:anoctamin-7-like n=1 Tax=Uloborus diversus TaxID=327109 RepID=UPI0024098FF0|nr:anoctamin-7-like [Uloborus diversus]
MNDLEQEFPIWVPRHPEEPQQEILNMDQIHYILVYEDPNYKRQDNNTRKEIKISLRKKYIEKLEYESLLVEEQRVGKQIFVKIYCPLERLYREAEVFRVELPVLEVYNILININTIEGTKKKVPRSLLYLLMIGVFQDAFPVHDASAVEPRSLKLANHEESSPDSPTHEDLRLVLSKKWATLCHKHPIHEVKDYFGEKIAFYFAWVSTYMMSLWIPSVLGILVFAYGYTERPIESKKAGFMYFIEVVKSSCDNTLTPVLSAIMCLWGTVFMEIWKRKQISLARQWNVDNFDHVELDRPQFHGTKSLENEFTQEVILYFPATKRLLRYTVSVLVLLMMVMIVYISISAVLFFRLTMIRVYCEDDEFCKFMYGTVAATMLNTLSIMILGKFYEKLAGKLTEYENHQTLSLHNDALILKLFIFQFVNTYAALFFAAFLKGDLGLFSGMSVSKLNSPRMNETSTEGCDPSQDSANCMFPLSCQLLILMIVKPIPKFIKDVIVPGYKRLCFYCYKLRKTKDEEVSEQSYLMHEFSKPSAEDFTLLEFTEKIIQYGYLMMFATALPLAPILALLFNIIDFRIDTWRLLVWNRRPIPYRDNDIGMWMHIINFINFCGIISNAFLIAFNSRVGRGEERISQATMIVLFEITILFLRSAICFCIPDVPMWVKNSRKKERFLLSYLMTRNQFNSTIQSSQDNLTTDDEKTGEFELEVDEANYSRD